MRDYTVLRHSTWLEPHLPLLGTPNLDDPLLELGCGPGDDTHYLSSRGYSVIATDRSKSRLAICAVKAPGATRKRVDLEEPLPFEDASFSNVLASLCLHYFEEQKTIDIVNEIHRCMKPGGHLIARFNSTNDTNFGAVGFPEIGRNFYRVHGNPKRFFDADALTTLFADGWQIVQLKEKTIDRYEKDKVVWELVAIKTG